MEHKANHSILTFCNLQLKHSAWLVQLPLSCKSQVYLMKNSNILSKWSSLVLNNLISIIYIYQGNIPYFITIYSYDYPNFLNFLWLCPLCINNYLWQYIITDHWRTGAQNTWKLNRNIWTDMAVFHNQKRVNVWEHMKKMALSFRMFLCACPSVISSIFGKSFHFPFPYFVLFVLRYFPFHMVYHNRYKI